MTNAESLMRMGKRAAAAMIQAEVLSSGNPPGALDALLDHLLSPEKDPDDGEALEWCRWIVGGGESYEDFSHRVKKFDVTEKCGLVWTADFVAFRCRTCGISQCMSLCAECFQEGNHEGHDFNMFKSQAGGACDCGDSSVMRPSGFCAKHRSPSSSSNPPLCSTSGGQQQQGGCSSSSSPPEDLLAVAGSVIPRIFLRLLQHLRMNVVSGGRRSPSEALARYEKTIEDAEGLLVLLHDFSSLGAAMRGIMTRVLIDSRVYGTLTRAGREPATAEFMRRSEQMYEDAVADMPNTAVDVPLEHRDYIMDDKLRHSSFLEELVFWTVKYEFPELLNCLLLKMLPDADYKEAFTRCFVMHYSRVSLTLSSSSNSDRLSNRVVHVSVQLFSNEKLALCMAENHRLLHVMVSSLVYNMMSKVLIPCRLHGEGSSSSHRVIDCKNHITKDHCYWPLVSDLSNVLSHMPIALKFMADNGLLSMWFGFLQMLQGMNVNERELESHIEFEPSTYYASFSAELEASASPMWALLSHLKDRSTGQYTANVIKHTLSALCDWFKANNFSSPSQMDPFRVSFHIPLHRYFSMFVRQGVLAHGYPLKDLLPEPSVLWLLLAHPLRVQTAFYEIMAGIWVRNGLQIKGQAMTYLQCHFCKSMVDADLFLLQICATQVPPAAFLSHVLGAFRMRAWLSFGQSAGGHESEQVVPMLEACLSFLASLMVLRSNLGLSGTELARLEMVALLCMGDKQHSKLFGSIPEKSANPIQIELFDSVLLQVGQYREPQSEAGGNMQQGIYLPQPQVWEDLYDPIYVLLRAVHRKDFQASIDRFTEYAKNKFAGDPSRLKSINNLWPPWRLPTPVHPGFEDPRRLLHSRFAHGLIFNILYKAVHEEEESLISEHIVSLAVFLLELALTFPQKEFSGEEVAVSKPWVGIQRPTDLKYETWFPTDWLPANLRHVIASVFIPSETESSGSEETQQPLYPSSGGSSSSDESTLKVLNESIISLLLKLHSKLSRGPDSYTPLGDRGPVSPGYRSSRIGNGPFFIEKVLDAICELDGASLEAVKMTRKGLWPSLHKELPNTPETTTDDDNRRKRARIRQRLMMEQLADQQRRFIAANMAAESGSLTHSSSANSTSNMVSPSGHLSEEEPNPGFDCVHCHLSSGGSEESPMGLVALLQPSSLLGHRRSPGAFVSLPSDSVGRRNLVDLGGRLRGTAQGLIRDFGGRGALALHGGWDWGLHIQSCGHMLHLSCRESYMEHLKSQQSRSENNRILDVELGEYMCPMCRQLGNSFLPLPPSGASSGSMVTDSEEDPSSSFTLHRLLSSPTVPSPSPLSSCGRRLVEEFIKAREGPPKPPEAAVLSGVSCPGGLFHFVSSIARTNLELDLVQRGGGACLLGNAQDAPHSGGGSGGGGNSFKTCFVPLLHVLSNHVKSSASLDFSPEWRALTGLQGCPPPERFVPLLLQDCSTLFLHFLLLLPVPLDLRLFEALSRVLYALRLSQSLVLSSCDMGSSNREAFLFRNNNSSSSSSNPEDEPLNERLSLVIRCLSGEEGGTKSIYTHLDGGEEYSLVPTEVSDPEGLSSHSLPFLRLLSLVRLYIYGSPLPVQGGEEGPALKAYCGLNGVLPEEGLLRSWLEDLRESGQKAASILSLRTLWDQPQLVILPKNYDAIFQYYHRKECDVCRRVPKDPSICLLCGELVCFKESCCRFRGTSNISICEAVRHSYDCGAGTAMFLAVNSSYIIVVRGRRACVWGSIYLDSFGEEDKELKRGRPLYLNEERYNLLRAQWINHRFSHNNRTWIWHWNQL